MNNQQPEIRTVQVMRYVTPLREGGSLPAIAEADDEFLYVVKFRGAGQGAKALIADLAGGEIMRVAGMKVPEIVFANLDETFGRTEPDEEIQDLLKASNGLNLGIHFLSGAITYDAAVNSVPAELASRIVWLDAFLMNVDRTVRNTNMLTWNKELWLIDHGACLYFHHNPENWLEQSEKPFSLIKDHVLLPAASKIAEADETLRTVITEDKIAQVVRLIPDEWLGDMADEKREMYFDFMVNRLHHSDNFVKEAIHARESLL